MVGFRVLLVVIFGAVVAYTAVVTIHYGTNFVPVFFGDMAKLTWRGQFNLDFMMMLTLSATWVAWRLRFTPAGLGLAVLAFFGGALFLSVYLLIISLRAKGGITEILVGDRAASAASSETRI